MKLTVEYCLSLSDGSSWWLSRTDEDAEWVDKLAAIMELKKSSLNGSPKLIFSASGTSYAPLDTAAKCVRAKLRSWGNKTGWSVSDPASLRIWFSENIPDVLCEVSHNDKISEKNIINSLNILNMCYTLQPIYQRSIFKGGLPLHAGLAELDGRGILLAAPGNSGKSTCCRRLPDDWKPLCDDKTLVVLDKHRNYRAHPFPTWSDYLLKHSEKTIDVQYSIPIHGIFFLEQSENNEVVPMGEGQAAFLMAESSAQVCETFWRTLEREDQRLFNKSIFDNACAMAKQIPAYRLHVSLHGRFWEKIEQVILPEMRQCHVT